MKQLPSSYRDSDGFVFEKDGTVYRYVQPGYQPHYDQLMNSGLYEGLVKKGWLISHKEITHLAMPHLKDGPILLPEQIPFISYPYEWSFDMWKDAALLTLQISVAALKKGMVLKDATPFNIQFYKGKPVFIDTVSFEMYGEGKPWVAYRQFCECFLGPLLLMHYCHPATNKLFTVYPNGIPVDLLVTLLPKRSRWNMNTFLHIHLQAKFSGNKKNRPVKEEKFSKRKFEILLSGLEGFVKKIRPEKIKTTWDDYYTGTILGETYLEAKTKLVQDYCRELVFENVIDLGANDGHFSLLLKEDKRVIAVDADPNCINELYLRIKKERRENILPLINDLIAPSPAIGWNNAERESLTTRLKADLVLALALLHHLAIAHNVPLQMIADWLQPMAENLIIEFVPKTDEKVKLLLQNREDIFSSYSIENFKTIFAGKYLFLREDRIADTGRVLFLMKRKG